MLAPPIRPEVIFVLDVSGSMQMPVGNLSPWINNVSGSDCGGNRSGTVDFPHDGICSGLETAALTPSDCIANVSVQACHNLSSYPNTRLVSRMYLVKRALSRVISQLAGSVNFGLVTFTQSGYHYYQLAASGATTPTSIFLGRWQLQYLGAWDAGEFPKTTFTWNGTTYTLLSSSGLSETRDCLYSRTDNSAVETRNTWAAGGESYSAGGFNWTYRGSYYVYNRLPLSATALSPRPAHYMGPQFVSGVNTYVYYPYRWEGSRIGTEQYISETQTGLLVEAIEPDQSQALQNDKAFHVINRFNLMSNGGVMSLGYTPTGPAINTAAQHFLDRNNGTGPFSTADALRDCRNRMVVVVTDGKHNSGQDPWVAAQSLYNNATFASNRIVTMAVAVPGMNSASPAGLEVRRIADAGDDGAYDFANPVSANAYFPATEDQLVSDLNSAISAAVSGDFATSSAGASTSGATNTTGDWAILPSVEYPGWYGHLRAFDLTQDPVVQEWDVADDINTRAPYSRRIFTGYPSYDADSDGTEDDAVELLNNGGSIIDAAAVQAIATAAGSTTVAGLDPSPGGALEQFLQWLHGNGRTNRLGPILRCTPATIGTPPAAYSALKDHAAFASAHAGRETLIYITSNEGLIHAIRAGKAADEGGTEVFAFIPPNLLDKAYQLYIQGGQDSAIDSFDWILASSPRVDDVKGDDGWFTQLVVAMGPGTHALVALDISDPTDCSSTPCTLRSDPLRVMALAHPTTGTAGVTSWKSGETTIDPFTYGEAWSVPSLYWSNGGDPNNHMSAGSGYAAPSSTDKYLTTPGNTGHYYHWWDEGHHIGKANLTTDTYLHNPASVTLQVDAAVIADSVAVMEDSASPPTVIATYQADLEGRIVRFQDGKPTTNATIVSANASRPLYYSPAAMQLTGKQVVLAFNSASADEGTPPSPNLESYISMVTETNGVVDGTTYNFSCPVGSLSTCASLTLGTGVTGPFPSSAAKPVSTPLLVLDESSGSAQVVAFYLLYEPTATASCAVSAGSSWLIRISVDAAGTTNTIDSVTQVAGRTSGMSLAGGGTRVVLSKSAVGGGSATVDHLGSPVDATAAGNNPPTIEYWREVK